MKCRLVSAGIEEILCRKKELDLNLRTNYLISTVLNRTCLQCTTLTQFYKLKYTVHLKNLRTGRMLCCDHEEVRPDIVVLGKVSP